MPLRHSTNREIEVKLRVSDVSGILRRLRSLGAFSRGRVLERNALFDTPDSNLRRSGCLLRLRVETPAPSPPIRAGQSRAVLTTKVPITPGSRRSGALRYKEKLEREVEVWNPEAWPTQLRSLGFRRAFRYEKYRSSFVLRGLHIDLDETPVGVFLELEGAPRAIDRTARALGFSSKDYIRATYWDVYAADCRRRGIRPKNLLFRP
ncbi:MAG: class IV adenylate cyclase [Candidatus Acidiferrales bacterium]